MFFILSKILSFSLRPVVLMAMLGVYALFTKNPRRKKRSVIGLVGMLLFFTNPWIINQLAAAWEIGKISPDTIVQPYEVGILLGGYTDNAVISPSGVQSFSRAVNRLTETLALYQTGKIKHILLTGGSGRLVGNEVVEATIVRKYLLDLGIPDSSIWVEGRSRNTWENALYSKQLIDSLAPHARCLLITSAWHLRRAKACYDRAGLSCDIFGADYFEEQALGNPFHWVTPDWKPLMKWDYLLKEWVGWVAYRFKGYG